MYKGEEFLIKDFSGGLSSARPSILVEQNQAQNLRNIVITPGKGIEKRRGNTVFNSSAMASGAAVTGLHAFKLSTGNEYLVATAGSTIQQGITSGSTMTDITGALTITSNQNNLWTISQMNDLAIGVGGAPDAPWKWSGAGNAALLGGSPPTGAFGFQHNNRFFIGNISGNPSRIQWSILLNPEDWASGGSGSADVWQNDGDNLVTYGILAEDQVLLFKQRSVHVMYGRTSPFPVIPLFRDVGAVGVKAAVVADGLCYWITPKARMKVTNGQRILTDQELPHLRDADDQWDSLNKSRLQYIVGQRYTGGGFDHIYWFCSDGSSGTNNKAIIWDIRNQCWLQHTTGHAGNASTKTQNQTWYMGAYDGKIYQQDVAAKYIDDSESSAAIDGYWASQWFTFDSLRNIKHPSQIRVLLFSQSIGNIYVGYGFDFASDKVTVTQNMQAPGSKWGQFLWGQGTWGGSSDIFRTVFPMGRGNVFQMSLRNDDPNVTFVVHGISITGERGAQKVFETV